MTLEIEERTATVDGVPMRWLESGAGSPVVLVHGIPTSPALWRHVLPKLAGARLLAWEMVGYGESMPQIEVEGLVRDISLARQAGFLAAWLREVGVRRAVLVGHDLGGGVVQIASVREPEICGGLVLTNCICYDSWPIPEVKMLRAAGGLVKHLPISLVKANLSLLFARGHDDRAMAKESLDVHIGPYARHGGARALVRQMKALHTEDTAVVADELPRLADRPARVVWGAADPFQKVHYGRRLAADLDAEITEIEGGKHFVPEDHPGEIAAAVEAVLREAETD